MANSKPTNKSTNVSKEALSSGRDITDANSLDRIYNEVASNSELHKSLDFSNVALFADNSGYRSNDEANFRHFHQMRIFIQIPSYFKKAEFGTLANTDTILLTSNLPDSISYSIGSSWVAPLNFGSGATNLLMQLGGSKLGLGGSGVPRATSLRIWQNTDPLSLNLTVPVIDDGQDDSKTNLMEALEILGMLTLPTLGDSSFYTPPPSPLNVSVTFAKDVETAVGKANNTGTLNLNTGKVGRILVQLGGILLIDNCIIESVNVTYPNTKAMIKHNYAGSNVNFGQTNQEFLHPLLAQLQLKISTVESTTADAYARMLWSKPQGGKGKLNFNASRGALGIATGAMYSGIKNTVDLFSGN